MPLSGAGERQYTRRKWAAEPPTSLADAEIAWAPRCALHREALLAPDSDPAYLDLSAREQ